MMVAVDKAGRMVLPKRLREQLGLGQGGQVEVTFDGAAIRLSVPPGQVRGFRVVDGWPVLEAVGAAELDDAGVRELRDEQR